MYNFTILYCKGLENDKANILSRKADYFNKKEQVKHSILRTNKDSVLTYNYMVLAAMFRVANDTFAEQLWAAVQNDKITQTILKEISLGDIEGFTQKDKILLF